MSDTPAQEPKQAFLPGRQALIVRLTAQEGQRAALLDLLNTYADGIGEEPGTEMYMVAVDPDDSNLVWLYEVFRDEDAENAHRQSTGFADLMHNLPQFLEGSPGILRMQPLRMTLQENMFNEDWSF
ncbi:MAG: antibiotic biosynthesis monooxygenase [Candidatus Nanopelagicales bacterium]|nr:antibiotic biosynthesis monooxygenase [Candidatus Nanopelagicales bacterium]